MIRIICAAIHFPSYKTTMYGPKNITEGQVLCGWRHANIISLHYAIYGKPVPADEVQGFLTSDNRFVGREEAMKIAIEANQIIRDTYNSMTLFSEDIY